MTSRAKRWQPSPALHQNDRATRKSLDDLADRLERQQVALGGSYAWSASLSAIPDNTLRASGATVNIADYPELFAVYGTTFGGDGVTTFALDTIAAHVTRVR